MRNKHHLIPRSRMGSNDPWNLLLIRIERHNALHQIFGNRTLAEIIRILQRVQRHKERQRKTSLEESG